jgi:hypothetical protein
MPNAPAKRPASKADPVFRARYRVLVLKNPNPTERHERAIAICLEQNVTGRGATIGDALSDLAKTLTVMFEMEWTQLEPHAHDDPDPEEVKVFETPDAIESDGYPVLARLQMTIEIAMRKKSSRSGAAPGPANVSYEPVAA